MEPPGQDDPASTDSFPLGCALVVAVLLTTAISLFVSGRSLDRILPILAVASFIIAAASTVAFRRSEAEQRSLRPADLGVGILAAIFLALAVISTGGEKTPRLLRERVVSVAGLFVLAVYLTGAWSLLKRLLAVELSSGVSTHQSKWRWFAAAAGFFFALVQFMIIARGG